MFTIVFYYNYYHNFQIVLKDINFFIFFMKKKWINKRVRKDWENSSNTIIFNSYILKDLIFFIQSIFIKEEYTKLLIAMYTQKKKFIYLNKKNVNVRRIQYNYNNETELLKCCNLENKLNKFVDIVSYGKNGKNCKNGKNGKRGSINGDGAKYGFYFRIYKKEKGIKNSKNRNEYINNIYIYIESIYLKIKNLNNIYSLISNIPDKFVFILYYIINKYKNLKENSINDEKYKMKYQRNNDIYLNVRLNFIEVELKNRNMASFFFCVHNLVLYNGNGKLYPYKRQYSSNFKLLKKKQKK